MILLPILFVGVRFVAYFLYYFYRYILPFLVRYVGLPLFVIGCFMAFASAGSIFISLIAAAIIYYLYMKKIYDVNPFERKVQ